MPIMPPKASISLTTIPFAEPPIDGLHGMLPIISLFKVKSNVFLFMWAQAKAASRPACPPPTTMTS